MTNKTELLPWRYCPECGSEEIRHEEGEHKQCAICYQEWFSSIDYSDVVRKHLGEWKAITQSATCAKSQVGAPAEDARAVVEGRITKKAKVGSVIFSEGVKESAVIQCAQRAYELSQQPEVESARLDRLRATLSEIHSGDVRAVVEEPVGYAQTRDIEKISGRNVVHVGVLMSPKPKDGFVPLYRHPQRPVVLPERMQEIMQFLLGVGQLDGLAFGEHRAPTEKYWWRKELRACLDEYKRLNP